jgi:hypothetical protein
MAQAQLNGSLTLSPEQGCRFKGGSRLKLTNIAGAIQAETDAMNEAREEAQKTCRAAGWRECGHNPQYTKIVAEYFSTLDQFRVQYEATVQSGDCHQAVQEVRFRDHLQVGGSIEAPHFEIKPESVHRIHDSHRASSSRTRSKARLEDHCDPRAGQKAVQTAELMDDEGFPDVAPPASTGSSGSVSRNTAIPGDCNGTGRSKN